MLRLSAFAVLSEIPFDLACYREFSWQGQNVFLTLLLCLLMLWLMELIQNLVQIHVGVKTILLTAVILTTAVLTWGLQCDYGFSAPFLVAGFYFYKADIKHKPGTYFRTRVPYGAFFWFLAAMFFGWILDGYSAATAANGVLTESFCVPAVWLIGRCSGVRCRKGGKYFFYLYYPLHLIILYGVSLI